MPVPGGLGATSKWGGHGRNVICCISILDYGQYKTWNNI